MNRYSKVARYIFDHPAWEKDFKEMNIKVSYDENLAIFKYGMDADFSNPVVREARGIILDMDTLDVVCWGFDKFGNYSESYADTIDWSSAEVQEKVDGSIVKLYYHNGFWKWATNGVIRADKAKIPNCKSKTFFDLIASTVNLSEIQLAKLNTDYTYIFELVSPLTRIVIDYKQTMLYHLGTRDNATGQEYDIDIGIQKPKKFPLRSFEDALAVAQTFNASLPEAALEGFVVVDKYWHRIKIKTPEYIAAHHTWGNGAYLIQKQIAVSLALEESDTWDEFAHAPYVSQVRWYQYQLALLEWRLERYFRYVRGLYEEFEHDRGAVACVIKEQNLSTFGFKAIGNNKTPHDIIRGAPLPLIVKHLPDYELPEFIAKGEWYE